MKVYLGGPMFSAAEAQYNLTLTKRLRECGFEVYCPNENVEINDKTRTDITGEKIYLADIKQIENSNAFLCQVAEDSGTMWEAGYMDCLSKFVDPEKYYGCIGLSTDIRLATKPNPKQSGVDNQSCYLNQFVVGGLKLSLGIYTDEKSLINKMLQVKKEKDKKVKVKYE